MQPDERTFRRHVDNGPFQAGVDRGDWRLVSMDWPHAVIAVAAPARLNAPSEVALRFELSGYPQQLPTAQPWDAATNAALPDALWPIGDRVSQVFNPSWNRNALYIPCDRLALEGHEPWLAQHPAHAWNPDRDITHYLRIVRDVLREPGYAGVRQQAA
jgi:hypothetical protein